MLYLKNSIFMNFLMKKVKFFKLFSHVFSTWRILNKQYKTIGLQRRDFKLKSRARIKSIRQKEGKWQQFLYGGVHWTPCDRRVIFRRCDHNGLMLLDNHCRRIGQLLPDPPGNDYFFRTGPILYVYFQLNLEIL